MSRSIPNSFQVPNAVVDELITELSGNAFKIYLSMLRGVPPEEIPQKTGLSDKQIAIALAELHCAELIVVEVENEV
ncbi:hypothetical protein [Rodentibacter pneumotropicus]|uniref:hypothetical protein n=1 Tax=Rodentibacter pneumotropicus TaxID=758 RepID=UPI00109CBFA7|nr:hypothetical protein [Rodentibacter pneumotropicus]THA09405.1 hypothetical protein D3M77_02000 [Rodentibacter pneumotropicus]